MKNQTVVLKKIAPAQEFIAELSGRLIEMVESGSTNPSKNNTRYVK